MEKKINIKVLSSFEVHYDYYVSEDVFTKFFRELKSEEVDMDELYRWLENNCNKCKFNYVSQNDPHIEFLDISEGE